MNFNELPVGENAPKVVNVVVEIPKGSNHKYEYDPKLNIFRLDRTLFSPMHYPGDYGFVPGTLEEDGDPIDALVLLDHPTFPGCVIRARVIGLLEMTDGGKRDDKLLCVAAGEPRSEKVRNYTDIEAHRLREIGFFFDAYGVLEGKKTAIGDWQNSERAQQFVTEARERHRRAREKIPRRAAR
jgi:inorganic pyrophosphatase